MVRKGVTVQPQGTQAGVAGHVCPVGDIGEVALDAEIITLNCHGIYNSSGETRVEIPPNVFLVIPHPEGFDRPFDLVAQHDKTFEKSLYSSGQSFLTPSSGWKICKPGTKVRDTIFNSWSQGDRGIEFRKWGESSGRHDVAAVPLDVNRAPPEFAIVPARHPEPDSNGTHPQWMHNERRRFKVKVFGQTSLRHILENLNKWQPNDAIIFITFTCNSADGQNDKVVFDGRGQEARRDFMRQLEQALNFKGESCTGRAESHTVEGEFVRPPDSENRIQHRTKKPCLQGAAGPPAP